ncbi:MAG: Integral rane protein [Flavipsychrobacter sp.]|nr:Integral rane protein [Flavipsychrobacter sp.]
MNKSRLEAFSDGVFAIIITIMILELKIPDGTSWEVIHPLLPKFLSYVLSFVYIAIYWNNHHHLMHTVHKINAGMMWANMHLLFWLSLVPFATGWMGETNFDKVTVAVYGGLLLLSGLAYTTLSYTIRGTYKEETPLTKALASSDIKGMASIACYTAGILLALFVHPLISAFLYTAVAIMWVVPSKRIEKALEEEHKH